VPPAAEVHRQAAFLEERRAAAADRQRRSFTVGVTDLVHPLQYGGSRPEGAEPTAEGAVAAAVGTEIHRLLEILDLQSDPARQLAARRAESEERLVAAVPREWAEGAAARFRELLNRLLEGRCMERLASLAGAVVARELPLLLPPPDERVLGFVTGNVDLVYREGSGLVVADYKTDRLGGEEALRDRVERYRPQVEIYARALAEALELDETPRTELWFLDLDRIVRL
jgi:ATP-dependent exoDNAse (exonuclease V) beta subunit